MQINPCREALTAGLEGSDEERSLGIVALIDQLRRSATGMLKQNGDENDESPSFYVADDEKSIAVVDLLLESKDKR